MENPVFAVPVYGVSLILNFLAIGMTIDELLEEYTQLNEESIRAANLLVCYNIVCQGGGARAQILG